MAVLRTKHPLYKMYHQMIRRCENPNDPAFVDYGARGINVCDRWRKSFDNFVDDMGPRPNGFTIERQDNDGNYEPGNCRWASKTEQQRNRRCNKLTEADVIEIRLMLYARVGFQSIADRFKISFSTIQSIHKRRIWKGIEPCHEQVKRLQSIN